MGNYSFELDLERAKETETEIARIVRKYMGEDVQIDFCDNKDYDLRVLVEGEPFYLEVKEDFMCMNTGNVCVEFECRGKPSGIAVSKAQFFVYKLHESPVRKRYYICSTKTLRKMIEQRAYHRIFESGGDVGSNTKGYLFKVETFKAFTEEMVA